ncbi:MAG TPA: putative baseplate assembly protein [Allosphingosinicella sp.]|nr:putative baseplate assembly protein [Allosphingosinicella sp.]
MSDLLPLIPGLADLPEEAGDCGCCEGIAAATPISPDNRPSLPAVVYRPGRFGDFRRSQLARLSGSDFPALAGLKSRENDDFSIALIDAWSCVCDVLAFYQERNANEAWLGTATERRSLVELGRLIGYRLRPGLAAGADLVFRLDQPPQGDPPVPVAAIPAGTRVQSVPGDGETAQTFETVEAIEARVAWNDLQPRRARPTPPANGHHGAWLAGVATGLKVGDAILILSRERAEQDVGSERWEFRRLTKVTADAGNNRTRIGWTPALAAIGQAEADHQLFTLRTRASLFGWNAPDPRLLHVATLKRYGFANTASPGDWSFAIESDRLHLDSIQQGFVVDGWIAVTRPASTIEVYRITEAVEDGRADYGVSGRVTRLSLDTNENLSQFSGGNYRKTSVYGASEALDFADTPIVDPVMGDEIELSGLVEDLAEGRRLIVRGRRAQVLARADGLELIPDAADIDDLLLERGARLTLLAEPVPVSEGSSTLSWRLRTDGGVEGALAAHATAFAYVAADETAEIIAETATLEIVEPADETHSALRLSGSLAAAFDRGSTLVHANVAAATNGESTQEILGDGDASRRFQSFTLKQIPLTHVSAASETGSASTLQVRVNDLLWHEVPTLYGAGPADQVYETRLGDDGKTAVQFGDGRTGARPGTGRNNIVAKYRKGLGVAGSVGPNTLTTAIDRPLGLREVLNPLSAAGGQDAETLAAVRSNAPVTTLTLGRVVSLRNYEDFARGFAGIAKARADWVWDGEARRIVVTVAGPGGEAIDPSTGDVFDNLTAALRSLGDPFVRITVKSYAAATFKLKASLKLDPDHLPDLVLAAVETTLRDAYGFERRGFARLVAASEVIAAIHSVPGIVAVDLDLLYRTKPPSSAKTLHARLTAQPVRLAADGTLLAAEILTLDPAPLLLEAMA